MSGRKIYILKAERIEDGTVVYTHENLTLPQAQRMLQVWWGELYADLYEIYYEEQGELEEEPTTVEKLRRMIADHDSGIIKAEDLDTAVLALGQWIQTRRAEIAARSTPS